MLLRTKAGSFRPKKLLCTSLVFHKGGKLCAAVFTCEFWRSARAATCRGPAEEPSGVIINPKGSVETDGLMVEDRRSSQHPHYFHWLVQEQEVG